MILNGYVLNKLQEIGKPMLENILKAKYGKK